MDNKLKYFLSILILLSSLSFGTSSFATGLNDTLKVVINPVNIIVNEKVAAIDSFELSGNIYVQPQDLCHLLNTDYSFNSKTKTILVNLNRPKKPIASPKRLYSTIKAGTKKDLKGKSSFYTIKINNKVVKISNYNINGVAFISVKEFTYLANRDFNLDMSAKVLRITEKKPDSPLISQSITTNTESDILVTISNWSNSIIKEYKIDNGMWTKYINPIMITSNCIIYARGTNVIGTASKIASLKISNIRKVLSKVQVSKFSKSVVKVIAYNKNNIEAASGSGFYITSDGNVVTNYHVVDKASFIEIEDYNKIRYKVSGVVNYDKVKDLAILKLSNSNGFSPLTLGDSDKIELGEEVVSMGYPLGLQITVDFGEVSSISPDIKREGYKNIQTSASISHGSSGGALMNMYGEVIGVTYATVEVGQNLNYAIPINDLKSMLGSTQLKTLSEVRTEQYKNVAYEQYSDYIYYDYFAYNSGDYKFSLDGIRAYELKNDPNSINLILYQYPEYYSVIEKAEANKDKAIVEEWIKIITNEVKLQYPSKTITVGLCHAGYSAIYPNAVDPNMAFYDKDKGEWAIFKYKIIYYYESGDYKFYWE